MDIGKTDDSESGESNYNPVDFIQLLTFDAKDFLTENSTTQINSKIIFDKDYFNKLKISDGSTAEDINNKRLCNNLSITECSHHYQPSDPCLYETHCSGENDVNDVKQSDEKQVINNNCHSINCCYSYCDCESKKIANSKKYLKESEANPKEKYADINLNISKNKLTAVDDQISVNKEITDESKLNNSKFVINGDEDELETASSKVNLIECETNNVIDLKIDDDCCATLINYYKECCDILEKISDNSDILKEAINAKELFKLLNTKQYNALLNNMYAKLEKCDNTNENYNLKEGNLNLSKLVYDNEKKCLNEVCLKKSSDSKEPPQQDNQSVEKPGLDLTSVLQRLVNLPDSSRIKYILETFPRGHWRRDEQLSAHLGKSRSLHESIETDARRRQQEQAPICSREFAVDDVVASSDAGGHPVSQKFNNLATDDDVLLTFAAAAFKNSFEVFQQRHPEELVWGFENGRLVFTESKSNLESSRFLQEQVVFVSKDVSDEAEKVRKIKDNVQIEDATTRLKNEGKSHVLEPTHRSTDGTTISTCGILSSKCINKRLDDSNSRIKYLENKLKEAGLTDVTEDDETKQSSLEVNTTSIYNDTYNNPTNDNKSNPEIDLKTHLYIHTTDDNYEPLSSELKIVNYSDFNKEGGAQLSKNDKEFSVDNKEYNNNNIEVLDLIPDGACQNFCQFNASEFADSTFNGKSPLEIYHDNDSTSDDSSSCGCDNEDHFIVIRRVQRDGLAMVNETAEHNNKHNPDRGHLKSLLKKPGRAKDKKSNRVVFNENKNEFFDADYIILIREDCELDEEDDESVCTCQQHEIVRLTCCEPNCKCQYESAGGIEPQSPKFAPPMEFVDAVTLSPPDGYKDMEIMVRGQQRGAVCKECSATHEEDIEYDAETLYRVDDVDGEMRKQQEKEKTDQSQQTTPTTPPSFETSYDQSYIFDGLTVTRNNQEELLKDDNIEKQLGNHGSPISGILKGGRLWKQQSQQGLDANVAKAVDVLSSDSVTSDEESSNKRSVRFIELEEKEKRDRCDGAPESSPEEEQLNHPNDQNQAITNEKHDQFPELPPEIPELTLTFKLGNHVLISNNSLKPNSAVRQLFPCTKSLAGAQCLKEEENNQQYLVTAESLRAFEEAKRSKLPHLVQSGETDETIKKAIERNTLRRSLIRYEPKSKKQPYKSDNSLVERIKQLTCDVDSNNGDIGDQNHQQTSAEINDTLEVLDSRASPPGEESRNSPDVNTLNINKAQDKTFSPSSSSTISSSSSTSNNQNNYQQVRKLSGSGEQILMMYTKRMEILPDVQNNFRREMKSLPDIGGPHNQESMESVRGHMGHGIISSKMSSSSNSSESRKQFLSSLAPLTACVTMGVTNNEDYYYQLSENQPGERVSMASSGTEYSLEDIDEGLKAEDDERRKIAPDVLAGTPSASESGDELAMFVQQDAGRIERIKKKYQPAEQKPKDYKVSDEDDENDDYGFNRRPSVRGIKPRFGSTTEILEQIQNQLQPPPPPPPSARVAWPYYSERGLTENSKLNPSMGNYQYINIGGEEVKRTLASQYRPTSLQDESLYQNCTDQRCVSRDMYHRPNANVYSSVINMGNECYQTLPLSRQKNARPQSPPPMDMSKQYHQTMVYIPYNHIEGYQPIQYYHYPNSGNYVTRVSNQNQINKRYVEPIYQSRMPHYHTDDHYYNLNVTPPIPPKSLNRISYPNGQPPPHSISGSRSESPLSGNFSTARSTQTPANTMSTCGYYSPNPRFRPTVGPTWQGEGNYTAKVNRHSFPVVPSRYPPADTISLTDSDSQHSGSVANGVKQSDLYNAKNSIPNSPTKPRFIERGVPEGAASVSPQDASGVNQSSNSTMTSPTSSQNQPVPTNNNKAVFYGMNV